MLSNESVLMFLYDKLFPNKLPQSQATASNRPLTGVSRAGNPVPVPARFTTQNGQSVSRAKSAIGRFRPPKGNFFTSEVDEAEEMLKNPKVRVPSSRLGNVQFKAGDYTHLNETRQTPRQRLLSAQGGRPTFSAPGLPRAASSKVIRGAEFGRPAMKEYL